MHLFTAQLTDCKPSKMVAGIFLSALVLLGSVSDSWQRCFEYHCPHHSTLVDCVSGAYTCQADEFCETQTHLDHGNAPWVITECRPNDELANCWATQASNDPGCDPNKHDLVCHWCCADEQCMRDLTTGVFPTAGATMPPASTAVPVDTTVAGSGSTAAPVSDTTAAAPATATIAPDVTSMPPAADASTTVSATCVDVYLGDCSQTYAGRCSSPSSNSSA